MSYPKRSDYALARMATAALLFFSFSVSGEVYTRRGGTSTRSLLRPADKIGRRVRNSGRAGAHMHFQRRR